LKCHARSIKNSNVTHKRARVKFNMSCLSLWSDLAVSQPASSSEQIIPINVTS